MSETSEDKSKRKYLKVLKENEWSYQYSVFYDDPVQSVNLLDDMVAFKRYLRRQYKDQPFLFRIQTHMHKEKKVLQALLTLFTTVKLTGFDELTNKAFPSPMNTQSRRLTDDKLASMVGSIEKQKSHDLSKIFNKVGQNQWGILNKPQLVKGASKNPSACETLRR